MSVVRNNTESTGTHLDILKNSITHSNIELHELVHNHQKFVGTVHKLNNQAKTKITIDRPKEALVYLNEAQKILQYAASCGKNIDRNLIVCVLHNQACCHQRLWELDKCSNYIEALIFNINSHLSSEESTLSKRSEEQMFQLRERQDNLLAGKSINNRMQMSKYYLQFCAINSQLRNHNQALHSGRQAISIIKSLLKQLHQLSKDRKDLVNNYSPTIVTEEPKQEFQEKMKIIHGIAELNDETIIDYRQGYIATAKQFIRKWNVKKLEQKNQTIKESLQNFSIGNIMQIKPISFQENKQSTLDIENAVQLVLEERYQGNPLRLQTYHSILNKVLLLTIGYFAIATQLRLIANQRFPDGQKASSKEYRQSQIYHLISIILSSLYIPFQTLYMKHILTSFSNHYGNVFSSDKLYEDNGQPILQELFLSHLKRSSSKDIEKLNKKKNKNKNLSAEHVESIRVGTQSESLKSKLHENKEKDHFSSQKKCSSIVLKKQQMSLSSRKQKLLSTEKIDKKDRVKSELITKLKQCLTPENVKTKDKKQLKKSPKKIRSEQKIDRKKMKSSYDKTKNKKKHKEEKQRQKQKQKTIKGQYFQKVPKGKEKHEEAKQLKDNKKIGKLMNSSSGKLHKLHKTNRLSMKTSPSQQVLDREKKGVKKNIDKYYF